MALQLLLSKTDSRNALKIDLPAAYAEVLTVAHSKSQQTGVINTLCSVAIYPDTYSRHNNGSIINSKTYPIPGWQFGQSENDWAQAYSYLKTLPEFAGAVDC